MKTKVIIVACVKGGVGKTTLVAAMGDVLARKMEQKVLLIDSDPQANLSRRFGYDDRNPVNNSLDVYMLTEMEALNGKGERIEAQNFISPCAKYSRRLNSKAKTYENLDIVVADKVMDQIYSQYAGTGNAGSILIKFINNIKKLNIYDYIIIDTQPNISFIMQELLKAADYVITPVTPNVDAFAGANSIGLAYNKALEEKRVYNPDANIEFLGALINKNKNNTIVSRELRSEIDHIWKDNEIFETVIPNSQDVESSEFKKAAPVTIAYPASSASIKLVAATHEIVDKINKLEKKYKGAAQA